MKQHFSNFLIVFIAFICGGLTMYYFANRVNSSETTYLPQTGYLLENDKQGENSGIFANNLNEAISNIYDATVMINNYQKEKLSGTGSGFVYKVDEKYGYILTNHHVIDGGDKITLYFNDEKEIDAIILGSDQYLDLAVLRIDKEYVTQIAKIGKSTVCSLGDTVFAIGSPIGYTYRGTVTNGIISGLNRFVSVSVNGNGNDWVMEVIQTNTAVNPGNSGGPLCNDKGEVIGIISLKLVQSSVEGMGFAIPIEDVMNHIDILESGQKIARPLLGLSMLNVSAKQTLEKYYDINIPENIVDGVVVIEISKDSGASKSSLKKGDIITHLDGEKVKDVAYLKYLLYKHNIGDKVELTYYRDGVSEKTAIVLTQNNE